MRPDRFITLSLVQPLRRARAAVHASRLAPLPILMYHSISDDPEPGVRPYYRVCTSPRRFQEQMQWLKDNGYRGVTLSDGLAWLKLDAASRAARSAGLEDWGETERNSRFPTPDAPLRPVVLTFDDGFRDFYTAAFPAMQRHGFTATMFLATAFIGSTPRASGGREIQGEGCVSRRSFNGRDCLTWEEVRELHRAGMEFGSHTVTHPKLVELSLSQIEGEISRSKAEIESHLGVRCPTFAYPYAFPQSDRVFRESFKNLLTGAGYDCCVTTEIGRVQPGDDPYCLKRLPVNSMDDLALLQVKLAGDYDWLASAQMAVKMFKYLCGRRNGARK